MGLTIGLQRTVIPALAETEIAVVQGSVTAIFAFIVSFGIVKGAMNFVSGRLSERGGPMAPPIPFMILRAPSWGWIVAGMLLVDDRRGKNGHRERLGAPACHRVRRVRGLWRNRVSG